MKLESILLSIKSLDLRKVIFAFPFFLIFIANLFITRIHGFEYAGKLAIFAGISTFVSIIYSMRWDVEILVKDEKNLSKSLSNGIYVVIFLSIVSLSVNFLLKSYIPLLGFNSHLLFSASLIAFFELHINIFLKKNNLLTFIILRSLPPVLLVAFTSFNLTPELSWFLSYFLSLIPLLLSIYILHKKVWSFNFSVINLLTSLKVMLPPTLSATIANSIGIIWLIAVASQLGSYEAGIWINAYRIASLPVAFCGAVIMPLVLVTVGSKSFYHEKFRVMFNFSYLILFAFFITSFFLYTNGQVIFSFLTKNNLTISNFSLLIILLVTTMQYFMQYWKELFQSVNKTFVILIILSIELFLAFLIYFFSEVRSFDGFINLIFIVTGFCFCLFLIYIFISYVRFKKIHSSESSKL
tara:strand:- start:10 stop:1239 length:1230 start_codon:yes stop_codon:yes gene_type:complete